ncbi:ricin-type beta-trefoil lectin domain protein [Dactylosporangium darangshiense]
MAADDSPTVADVAPAFAIVAEEDPEDAEDYRGTRRRTGRWRRLPVGALAVAVLILLITGAVAIPILRSGNSGGSHDNGLPGRVPGVDVSGLPEPAVAGAPSADDSASDGSSPTASASRTRSASAAASRGSSPSAAATSASAAPKPPPPPAQPASGRLHGEQSGLCIEFRTTRNSVILILDNCDAQASNQHFRVQGDLSTGAALLTDGGWCVDVQNAGTGNGNAVWVYKCNNTPAQRWIRHPNNTWENPVSHRCLDAANGGTAPGTPLIIWDCKATDNQIWTMS